ncbi:hypothetical protein ACFOPX_04465 [Helicobacter baculiformis]|uniref:Uncharacterized protein n=1 Tax=Helicobacter baculiformis TaxID=427351 RepID=A0ABV7ZJY9_9HELI|nr:hypothetical protein [Helicobacter baculiformis]
MRATRICVLAFSALCAQSDYCSDVCYGNKDSRIPPMEFHLSLPHSIDYYLKHPRTRAKMLKKCQKAFSATGVTEIMTETFKKNCTLAKQAQDQQDQLTKP